MSNQTISEKKNALSTDRKIIKNGNSSHFKGQDFSELQKIMFQKKNKRTSSLIQIPNLSNMPRLKSPFSGRLKKTDGFREKSIDSKFDSSVNSELNY